jgi:hypothetical protein
MDMYYDRPTPTINYAFLDIEVDYTAKKSNPSEKIKVRKKSTIAP